MGGCTPSGEDLTPEEDTVNSNAALLHSELSSVACLMRQNSRFSKQQGPDGQSPADLLQKIATAKRRLISGALPPLDEPLNPLYAAITSSEATAPITAAALGSVRRIFLSGIVNKGVDGALEAAKAAVGACTGCRFESTEPASDEIVLARLASALEAVCSGEIGHFLSPEEHAKAAREVFACGFRTGRESALLQNAASESLHKIVESAFSKRKRSDDLLHFLSAIVSGHGEGISGFGLRLLATAFRSGGKGIVNAVGREPVETACKATLTSAGSAKGPETLIRASSTMLQAHIAERRELKQELQVWLIGALIPKAEGKSGTSWDQQRAALEAVVDMCRLPGFASEVFANFDCDTASPNLLEDHILALLSRSAFPVSNQLSPLHLLSMEGIASIVHGVAERTASLADCSIDLSAGVLDDPTEYTDWWSEGPAKELEGPATPEEKALVLRRAKHVKRRLLAGADHFNRSHKHGLEFLQGINLLPTPLDPTAIALFLRHTPNLDKHATGFFLGEAGNLEVEVLRAYVNHMDMRGMNLEEALRIFLSGFVLPGEAQKISRVLEHFAERFVEQNPDQAADSDSAFALSYSIIMLNTDLHSSKVKNKMTLEQFIKNNRGMNGGNDWPRELLESIYNSIKNSEIRISSEDPLQSPEESVEARWADKRRLSCSFSRSTASCTRICPLPSPLCEAILDADLLSALWGPAIASISVVFDHASDTRILEEALEGFAAVARAAAAHQQHSAVDSLVASLCRFAPLLSSSAMAFGDEPKARMAAETVFSVAHRHGSSLRSGWFNIIDALHRFNKCGLLPPLSEHSSADASSTSSRGSSDRVSTAGTRQLLSTRSILRNLTNGVSAILSIDTDERSRPDEATTERNEREGGNGNESKSQRQSTSVLKRGEAEVVESASGEDDAGEVDEVGTLSMAETADVDDDEQGLSDSERRAKACVKRCMPAHLLRKSGELEDDSLDELIAAVMTVADAGQGRQLDEVAVSFAIRVMGIIARNNIARIGRVWEKMLKLAESAISESKHAGKATVAAVQELLRVPAEVLQKMDSDKEEDKRLLIGSIRHLFALEASAAQPLMATMATGIRDLVERAKDQITEWDAVCRLIGLAAPHPEASPAGLEGLRALAQGGLPKSSVEHFVQACTLHAKSRGNDEEASREAVSLLRQAGEEASEQGAWMHALQELRVIACEEERAEARDDAVLALQRVALAGLGRGVTGEGWARLLEAEVLPVAKEAVGKQGRERTARLAMGAACKVLVHALDEVAADGALQAAWAALVACAERCLKRERAGGDLSEAIAESLKSATLVMSTKGLLDKATSRALSSSLSSCPRLTKCFDTSLLQSSGSESGASEHTDPAAVDS